MVQEACCSLPAGVKDEKLSVIVSEAVSLLLACFQLFPKWTAETKSNETAGQATQSEGRHEILCK